MTVPFWKVTERIPNLWQAELKRIHYRRQIKKGAFLTNEPEFKILHDLIGPGDWVLDVGANVGHYTKRLSDLVGPLGRVIAFEPVPSTFAYLAANTQLFAFSNVSLINSAVSDKFDVASMAIPQLPSGYTNFYEAHLSDKTTNALTVLTVSVDSLSITHPIALVKIDVEGHESFVLKGMQMLITKYHPILIVETGSKEVITYLESLGYISEKLTGSPNFLFRPKS